MVKGGDEWKYGWYKQGGYGDSESDIEFEGE